MGMEKQYGISNKDLERILDQYVLTKGAEIDVERLREGLKVLVEENNQALIKDMRELINNNKG
jgi:hypothetical protein